tara:strand:- start:2118 stop:2795 length:678 start_codon:yes stop_codon:yes gene_type:complete
MADSDYTVAVVLQASDEGMSNTLKKASKGIEEVGNKSKDTKVEMMATIVALEGLTSGLNQVTGGARKFTAAMQQTGNMSDESAEKYNRYIAMIELATGPMESIIAVQKIATITSAIFTKQQVAENTVKGQSVAVNTSLAASWALVLLPIIAIVAIFATLYIAFKKQEEITKSLKDQFDSITGALKGINISGNETVQVLAAIAAGALATVGPMKQMVGFIPGIGGD